jgi:hypothetical protein
MESFSRFVSQHAPWFWGLLAWSLAILGLLAVATIPAYLIFYPIATNVRRGIGSYLSQLFSRHATAREARRQSIEALVEDFRCNSGISYISERSTRLEAALASFSEIAKAIKPRLDHFLDVPRAFERIGNGLADAAAKSVPGFPNIPAADQISAQHGSLRTAKVRLLVSSAILIALISVNTGMLGQILKDLGFIPHDLVYFGIPLYLVFAFILTLAEAGLGYVHTAGRPSPDEPPRVAVWPAIAVCFAVVIACVEGFFYSQVAPSRASLVDLPIGFQIKQGTLFFLWGATLVLVLFGLGTIWSTALERTTRSADHFPALVRRLSQYREKFATASESAARSAGHLKEEVEAMRQMLQAAAQETASLLASVAQLKDAASGTKSEVVTPRPLTTAEAYHFVNVSGVWFFLTLLGMVIVTASGFFAVGYTFPFLASGAAAFAAFGLAACFVVLGLVLPRDELLLDGQGTRRLIVSGSPWRGRTAFALAVVIVLAFFLLLWRLRMARYQAALWIGILVLGGSLAVASSRAAATGKGLRLWLHSCANFLLAFMEAVVRVCGRFLLGVTYFVEVLALAVAAPIFLLRGRELPSLHAGPS